MSESNLHSEVVGLLPFDGKWIVGSTPADRIPSHGTDFLGVGYAIDFIAVDDKRRTSSKIGLKTFLGSEKPENFHSFGKSILSPISGKIIKVHDGEVDHNAYRSIFAIIPYIFSQRKRVKEGIKAIAGNYVIIKVENSDYYIAIVHLKKNSITVEENQDVVVGDIIAKCGNSGNSTQPHIHIQAMTSLNFNATKGIPLYFERYIQVKKRSNKEISRGVSFPEKGSLVYSQKI